MSTTPTAPAPLQQLQAAATALLAPLGVAADAITVTHPAENRLRVHVQAGQRLEQLITRYHGEGTHALELLLNASVLRGTDWHADVDVNNRREQAEQQALEAADRAATAVELLGEDQILPPMDPYLRRLVHMRLRDHAQLATESLGEGRDRRVRIYRQGRSGTAEAELKTQGQHQ